MGKLNTQHLLCSLPNGRIGFSGRELKSCSTRTAWNYLPSLFLNFVEII